MKIKTYVVDNLPDVYPLIFQDLGEEAFILNTKPIRRGGFFGLFQKKQVEVVAAADLSRGLNQQTGQATVEADGFVKGLNQSSVQETKLDSAKEFIAGAVTGAGQGPAQISAQGSNQETILGWNNGLSKLQSVAPKSPLEPEVEKIDSQQEVLKELSEMKSLIHAMVKGDITSQTMPKSLETWVLRLRDHEVDEEVIQYIIKKAQMSHGNIEILSDEEVEQILLTIVTQLFEEGISKDLSTNTSSFITLLGPTGVGKTTTIAKLAAAQVFQQRQRVGLLTTDTFRIGAVEQLKTYANILNVPLEVVGNAEELKPSMEALKGCQIVFMDSAGRNYLEDVYVKEINQYLRYDVPQENYLVLSMTTRWRDMRNIVERMKSVPIDKLILTKWDETSCYGVALNMLYHYPYPLAYLCLGQGVPQDIMIADSLFMAKKILGVDENDSRPSTSLKTII